MKWNSTPRTARTPRRTAGIGRKRYEAPRLEVLGDLRTLTLGGSPGVNDSGAQFTEQPFIP